MDSIDNNEFIGEYYVKLQGITTSLTDYETEWSKFVVNYNYTVSELEFVDYLFSFYWLNVDMPDLLTF